MQTYYNDNLREINFENKTLKLEETKAYFQDLSAHRGSYIGFIDNDDDVIIFNFYKRNKWLVEHIVVANTLHRQRYATNEECITLIDKVYQEYDISAFKGFEDVPIGEFTLDQILLFKEEDEKLLNEEETPIIKYIPKKTKSTTQKGKAEAFQVMGGRLNEKKQEQKTSPTPEKTPPKITKEKPKTSQVIGERLNQKASKPETVVKKAVEKLIKNKPTDDNSFFQI